MTPIRLTRFTRLSLFQNSSWKYLLKPTVNPRPLSIHGQSHKTWFYSRLAVDWPWIDRTNRGLTVQTVDWPWIDRILTVRPYIDRMTVDWPYDRGLTIWQWMTLDLPYYRGLTIWEWIDRITVDWPYDRGLTVDWPFGRGLTVYSPFDRGLIVDWQYKPGIDRRLTVQTVDWPYDRALTIWQWIDRITVDLPFGRGLTVLP